MCVNIYLLVLALFLWWLDLRIHTLVTESVGGVGGGNEDVECVTV